MKKLISALAALAVLGLSNALAADSGTTLDKIEKACSAITSTQSHFDHNRTIKASGNTVKMEGILYYTAPDLNVFMGFLGETIAKQMDAGLLQNFDVVVGGDQVQRSKPEPDIFLKAAEQLEADPGDCYVIEDSYNGIRAASAAGMIPIMVPDLLPPTEEMEEKAAVILDSLHDVIAYLQER